MAASLVHRGPDDDGVFLSGEVGLGFRRLSIIDLEGGHQPMSDRDETVWVVFNGEIYNFSDLRQELESAGHVFRTRSDTEVIVHGYKQWGLDVFDRLNGMFGIALWDVRRRRLVLARDAMGIKPLYYRVADGTVLFGSEIRAILAALEGRPPVDTAALEASLRYGYTPAPLTLYAGIRKLAPGTMAIFEEGGQRVERWYRFAPAPLSRDMSEAEAAEELLGIYRRAVQRQLVSDVPVGLLLSGGVDSALLLGLMSERGEGWRTYTVGFGKSAHANDELADAAETAALFGAAHTPVNLTREDFETEFLEIVTMLEEPISAASIVPMYFVCKRAREDVKVALIGQGPDELFGGYARHLGIAYGPYWRRVPSWCRAPAEAIVERLPRAEGVRRGVHALSVEDRGRRYRRVLSVMPKDAAAGLLQPEYRSSHEADGVAAWWDDLAPALQQADELNGFLAVELRSALPDKLLMYGDKLSMAHGLEVRVPYLDREIVEFVERLPSSWKVRWGERKRLHRLACQRFLPKSVLNRRKRGFAVDVVDAWFRDSRHGLVDDYLMSSGARLLDYLDPATVHRMVDEHRAGRADNYKVLSGLVALEAWLRDDSFASAPSNDDAAPPARRAAGG